MQKALTLKELAQLTGAELIGDPHHLIRGVADLDSATASDASFLGNASYTKAMRHSSAGVVFVNATTPLIEGRNFLIVNNPSQAFQTTVELLLQHAVLPLTGFQGIHPSAVIHESAKIGKGVIIGPLAIIDQQATIGDRTHIGPGTHIGPHVTIGQECIIHARVVIREGCTIANRVILQPGVVVGSCGFGYTPDEKGRHMKLLHLAGVIIEDDVEIGANSTIDRGRLKPTRIGRGTKIDNLVQIAHGVVIGEDNIIVAQTGIAGSSSTGNHVIIAGQVAINGHIHLSDGVILAARSAVAKSIDKAGAYGGNPAIPMAEFRRQVIHLNKLDIYARQLKELRCECAAPAPDG